MLPCYEKFFGNFIFAIIAQTFSGNRLNFIIPYKPVSDEVDFTEICVRDEHGNSVTLARFNSPIELRFRQYSTMKGHRTVAENSSRTEFYVEIVICMTFTK